MSYDVDLVCKCCGTSAAYAGNYTYNVGPMFRAVLPPDGINNLQDMAGRDALPLLQQAITDFENRMDEMRTLNPSNGWGNADGALDYLRAIKRACHENPDCAVDIS